MTGSPPSTSICESDENGVGEGCAVAGSERQAGSDTAIDGDYLGDRSAGTGNRSGHVGPHGAACRILIKIISERIAAALDVPLGGNTVQSAVQSDGIRATRRAGDCDAACAVSLGRCCAGST